MRGRRTIFIALLAFLSTSGSFPPIDNATAGAKTWQTAAKPTPLTEQEERSPIVAELARRYNPAMAFPTRDLWPTSVSYSWHDGNNLMGRVVAKTGKVVREYIAFANQALQTKAWNNLPSHDADGNNIDYYVDAPGDDRVEHGENSWLRRWREIMEQPGSQDDVTRATYAPTQYAHLFWYNREAGLLGIQYWFYYPFDNWINRHEGDWEHINIIVKAPQGLTPDGNFSPAGYQFFFHGKMEEPKTVIRIGGTDPREDHVMVFAGGLSRFIFWHGAFSGGSYALPAKYPEVGGGIGTLKPADDTRSPKRFIHAKQFDVVLLPEASRLDTAKYPQLSWLCISFYAGQNKVYSNPFIIDWLNMGGPPQQPARKRDWNAMEAAQLWAKQPRIRKKPLDMPKGWAVLQPSASQSPAKLAGENRVRPQAVLGARRYLPTDWR